MVSGRKTGSRAGLFREMLSSDLVKIKDLALFAVTEAIIDTKSSKAAAQVLGMNEASFCRIQKEFRKDLEDYLIRSLQFEKEALLSFEKQASFFSPSRRNSREKA